MKKYSMTKGRMTTGKSKLFPFMVYQIQALVDIPSKGVKAGDLGGWVSSPFNLSQDGECWITESVTLIDESRVKDNALVSGAIMIGQYAQITGDATLEGDFVKVFGNTLIDSSKVKAYETLIDGNASIVDSTIDIAETEMIDNVLIKSSKIFGKRFRFFGRFNCLETGITNYEKSEMSIGDNVHLSYSRIEMDVPGLVLKDSITVSHVNFRGANIEISDNAMLNVPPLGILTLHNSVQIKDSAIVIKKTPLDSSISDITLVGDSVLTLD